MVSGGIRSIKVVFALPAKQKQSGFEIAPCSRLSYILTLRIKAVLFILILNYAQLIFTLLFNQQPQNIAFIYC